MKVTAERIEDCQMVLNVEVEPDVVERSMDKAYRKIVGKANIPGFRRGKAPRSMVERYFGRQALLEEALEELVPSAYDEAIKQENIEPIAQPKLEVIQVEPLSFKATVPLRPTVELGSYQQIKITPDLPVVTDEEVEQSILMLRERKSVWEDVQRPVQFGDQVVMDLESTVDGETFSNPGTPYLVEKDNNIPVPGFSEKLVGAEAGSTVEIDLQFPEDHAEQRLAGKSFHYNVTIQQVKERHVPELNDELAQSIDADVKTADELRENVAQSLKTMAEMRVRSKLENDVVEAVTASARVEFPPVLVEREIDALADEVLERVAGPQKIPMEQYLRYTGRTEEQFREELREVAHRRIRADLVLDEVSRAESIEATDDEINAEIKRLFERTSEEGSENEEEALRAVTDNPTVRDSIRHTLIRKKTLERLIEIATAGDASHMDDNASSGTAEEARPVEDAPEDQSTSEEAIDSSETAAESPRG